MKRVLITGATGALGQAVIEYMKSLSGYQIFATSSRINSSNNNLEIITCDLRNSEQLTMAFDWSKPDLILHLGAIITHNFSEAYKINVAPAEHLLDLICKRKSTTRMILIGSAAEYGVVRPEENPISEQRSLYPVSAYGVSKAWQTQLLGLYANLGVDVICARIFNLFGPGISEKLFAGRIQQQINAVKLGEKNSIEVGSLTAIRDYISIQEAARQLLIIATHGISGNIYHIGSGEPISMKDFLLDQLKLNGLSVSLIHEVETHSNHRGYDVPVIFADMKKTKNLEQ